MHGEANEYPKAVKNLCLKSVAKPLKDTAHLDRNGIGTLAESSGLAEMQVCQWRETIEMKLPDVCKLPPSY